MSIISNKVVLESILEKHKAQPVGSGYIDIIVRRENYKDFIVDLLNNDFKIVDISWWEWLPGNSINRYGMGGPISKYYDGWFSELTIDIDSLTIETLDKNELLDNITSLIENKSITFADEIVTYRNNDWLTPAIWLEVPDLWNNADHI